MLNFIRCIKGYLIIKISGYAPERFMNLCRNHEIVLWDIVPYYDSENRQENIYLCKVSIDDYKKTRPFLRKTGVKAVIMKKYGLPFLLHRNKKRKIFVFCIPVCILFLYLMTRFIWAFDFQGNVQVTDDMLTVFCEQNHVRAGTRISTINIEEMEKKLREQFDCITWTSIKVNGTRLVIAVNENDLSNTQKTAAKTPKDIIADADGIIVDMVTRNGVPLVKKGDEIQKGSVLVEGSVPIYDNDGNIIAYEYLEADADILLRYKYPVQKSIDRYYEYKHYTGRSFQRRYLRIGEKRFAVLLKKNKFIYYDVLEEEKQLSIYGNIYFPIFFGKRMYREYVKTEALYSQTEAEGYLKEYLNTLIKDFNEKGVQIIENDVKIEKNNHTISLSGFLVIETLNLTKQDVTTKIIEKPGEQEVLHE